MDYNIEKSLTIKQWAEEDRPREKLVLKGNKSLSDAELIAILIASGNKKESAVELSKRILASVSNNLNDLAKLSITDLQKFQGIGEAKAISIIAALELGRRRKSTDVVEKLQIKSSKDAYDILKSKLTDLPYEEFWMLFLNRSNKVIKCEFVSRGGIAGTVVDVKLILKSALDAMASGIVLAHNHPSGNLKPSGEDLSLTKRLKEAASFFDISILDHLIIGDSNFFSFADEGVL